MRITKQNGYYLKRNNLKKAVDAATNTAVIIIGILTVIPLLWMVRTSVMSNTAIGRFPPQIIPRAILLSNYSKVLNTFPFGQYFLNTMNIVVLNIAGVLITATLTAYVLARFDFKGKNFVFAVIIGCMLMPGAVTLIPVFIGWSRLGFYNTYVPLWVPAFLGGGSFNIFLIRQFILTIPKDLDEAALIDGAGRLWILLIIIIPLIRPVLIAVSLFTFIGCWNDVMGPVVYLSTPIKYTVSIALSFFRSSHASNYSSIMAVSTMSMLPAAFMYLIGQRYFVEGIVLSGLKS
ncbi:MAG: carbohydrate ABC transporter permease [Treponema sp.]|jgi:multiple sugar transport system permease protein|nr:carbohydrate ABC transporter permease [Treponema sp.]